LDILKFVKQGLKKVVGLSLKDFSRIVETTTAELVDGATNNTAEESQMKGRHFDHR
jgi:hypothetical protein